MKVGQEVNYYDPSKGERLTGVITEIVGAGPSFAKVLNISLGDKKRDQRTNVPHHRDANGKEPFWMIKGLESAPRGWAEKEKKAEVQEALDLKE